MLSVQAITKHYGKPILRRVSLDVSEGEIVCILGPSGCGKSTLLRIIAGLERPDDGDVLVDGASIAHVPVHERGFGFMFQDFALFPHMNVFENVRYGLRMRHLPKTQQDQLVEEALTLVGMRGFERRDVTSLSGGEKQRVALARSLAPTPRLLMLDEPLGSLDASLRWDVLKELKRILKESGMTTLYVTHDQSEAFSIGDRIAVMNAGRFEAIDAPLALYRSPKTVFTARFLGLENVLTRADYAKIPGNLPQFDAEHILIHPDGIQLDPNGTISGHIRENNVWEGNYDSIVVSVLSDIALRVNLGIPTLLGIDDAVRLTIDPAYVVPLSP